MEIQKADPRELRKVRIIAVLALTACGIILAGFHSYRSAFIRWFTEDPNAMQGKAYLVTGILALLCLPLLFGAVHIGRIGRKVLAARRFPPPGMAVFRDTPVLEGSRAVTRGRFIVLWAILIALWAILFPMGVLVVFKLLLASAAQ